MTQEEVLKNAKWLGMFQRNKSLKQYELIIKADDYAKL